MGYSMPAALERGFELEDANTSLGNTPEKAYLETDGDERPVPTFSGAGGGCGWRLGNTDGTTGKRTGRGGDKAIRRKWCGCEDVDSGRRNIWCRGDGGDGVVLNGCLMSVGDGTSAVRLIR
jgi:hypothetical protein